MPIPKGPAFGRNRLLHGGIWFLLSFLIICGGYLFLSRNTANPPSPPPPQVSGTMPEPPPPKFQVDKTTIRSGEVISQVLNRLGIDTSLSARLTADIRPVFDLARIHSGRPVAVTRRNGALYKIRYEIDPQQFLEAEALEKGGFEGRILPYPFNLSRESIRLKIRNSLFETITANGERPELADALATLFECNVDFNRDIQPGDKIKIWIEKRWTLFGKFTYGDILAAELQNGGRTLRVLRFVFEDGRKAYFQPDGKSVRTMFLKSPLPFMRVTSRFGMRRHPVLGFSAKHNGIDLGAPTGTPVRSTANGVVRQKGFDSVRGRFIIVRHGNGYQTHYYHLSRYRSGIEAGNRVQQGEIIGYVGNTGRSTGPHLHYGVTQNNRFMNPLRINAPREPSLPSPLLPRLQQFNEEAGAIFSPQATPVSSPPPLPLRLLFPDIRGR